MAQLVARLVRNEKVRGSNPLRSTGIDVPRLLAGHILYPAADTRGLPVGRRQRMGASRSHRAGRELETAIVARARAQGFSLDDAQRDVVARLGRLAGFVRNGRADAEALGMYLHGPAGRGKSWLADAFFHAAPTRAKRRVHFHGFLEELHRAIFARRAAASTVAGEGEPASDVVSAAIGDAIGDVRLLVFDEFHVHDPGDARLLTLVLHHLLAREVAVVATSNYAPEELLPNPVWHAMFEPGIALLRTHLEIVRLDGPRDYRAITRSRDGFAAGAWLVTPEGGTTTEHARLEVRGRAFDVVAADGDELVVTFAQLCEVPTSTIEYLDWAARFSRWTVRDVPAFTEIAPPARQRFVNVVDVLVDRGTTAVFTSRLELEDFIETAAGAGPDATRLQSRMRLLAARARVGEPVDLAGTAARPAGFVGVNDA